ncbi:hypothetical protein A2Z33_03170 [Candidatus Gottesmanbacteria bacterium RBG_16_52_11]|uniref:Phosphoribosyltransferase domain-containing protein n=1 Tax=Candidatus Gottesmanbacteria bacterium RBG_16_52_11 TaxID=1798374 RepID=A0A1F5YVA0_9BACT|nr:MAG: hypothetical protein A2Z33_03170 [Candidatus Gottesmanbacteria bacterium RBG_16_52_11]
MGHEYLHVSWQKYHALARKLASAILRDPKNFSEIIAISRGGLTLGHMLSDLLMKPISVFSIQSYSDIRKQGEVEITDPYTKPITGQHILLVDDVSDTGKTFIRARKHLDALHPASITTVSMFFKLHSAFRPDYLAQTTDRWIIFPYEPTEMITLITRKLEQEGKSPAYILKFLKDIRFDDQQIAFVRKHYPSHA